MDHKQIAEQIFLAGVESVLPERLIVNKMSIVDNRLIIGHLQFQLDEIENIFVIGAGKASATMGAEVEKILGNRITEGHIVVKYGHTCKLNFITISEAGHPLPDSNGFKATERIMKIADKATEKDLVICLLSGGGSALLADYPEVTSPDEMISVNNLLVNSGACITEINAVRKHLSKVKGGQLARVVYPATLVNLILSDVPGDPVDVIASGPAAPDPTTFDQALFVLEKFNLTHSVSKGILKYLKDGAAAIIEETPKPGDPVFLKAHNFIIGNNMMALEASRHKALEFNINSVIITDQLQGDASSVSEYLVETAIKFKDDENEVKPVCLLFGGETTVNMTGKGLGGRNQHLALLTGILLNKQTGLTVLCAGTDGTDGPTNATGAVVDSCTYMDALSKSIDPVKYLHGFDSFHFFKKAGGHIITGPTMTNVMDIIIVLVE